MDSAEAPRLWLVLDSTAKNSDAENTVWNPADTLRGHLTLSSNNELVISTMTIYFEGVSRNWISELAPGGLDLTTLKAECKFHSQAQDILPTEISRKDSPPEHFIYEAPFHFIISSILAKPDLDSPQQCLQLPPSLELGGLYIDKSTGKRFAQPCITYFLRASVSLNAGRDSDSKSLETSLPVIITPHTQEFPPTETKDFPSEFKEEESKVLRRTLIGNTLGTMKVSIHEPPPLTYSIGSARTSTKAVLNLEFESASSGDQYQNVQGLSFTILSLIRTKTFYSIKSFPRLPSQSLLSLRGTTRLRDEILKLETRTVRNMSWGYVYNVESQTKGATKSSIKSPPGGKWTTVLDIPIEVDTRLIPTFCSSIVARLYTVILRVKVGGVRRESFDLEVPLQVIHSSPDRPRSASLEPMREDQRFLAFHRASATSWFSDESLARNLTSMIGASWLMSF
ncbi:hypothetical protein NA56DRAFT_713667 [Hyaloscypha hepaticicola]|uniref:Arrestin-like N-terminal domain-containing protein n=1 Tax=Hyaloscypha hepaticicola TaxID=2082293 RepID=A0A2J6PD73_9HELO|nr:hypothetical protein NA56DRAFT_713667 [Hyaloscypha hepaticicola]